MDTPLESFKSKSFWERPEGTTGMIVGVVLGLVAIYGIGLALPFIVALLQNTLTAIGLGIALFGVIYVLSDRRFRTLVGYMYQSVMRAVTGIFITIDPIGILKSYVRDLRANLENMVHQLGNLRGQMAQLTNLIQSNERERVKALSLAKVAREQHKDPVFVLKARQAGRLQESNLTLQDLYKKMEVLLRVLTKMEETSEVLIEDIQSEVDVKTRERVAIRASYSAFRSALRIVRGEMDKKALFDQTMDYLAEDYGQKVGEIQQFLDMSKGFIDSVDLQNGVYEADALKQLEDWEKKGDSILLGGQGKQALLAAAYDADSSLSAITPAKGDKQPVAGGKPGDYGDLFKPADGKH